MANISSRRVVNYLLASRHLVHTARGLDVESWLWTTLFALKRIIEFVPHNDCVMRREVSAFSRRQTGSSAVPIEGQVQTSTTPELTAII